MTNGWKGVWTKNKVTDQISVTGNETLPEMFMLLKDYTNPNYHGGDFSAAAYERITKQFETFLKELSFSTDPGFIPGSFFDVGCATGSYLYYLSQTRPGVKVGGVDYSEPYIKAAKQFLPDALELYCSEAGNLSADIKYDCVYSRSIFQYFSDQDYGEMVIKKMLDKANHSVGILDVHDLSKREVFLAYRRSTVDNYDEKYKDMQHLFYPKSLFIDVAEEYDCDVKFAHCFIPGYWNAPYTYDVYFYKR